MIRQDHHSAYDAKVYPADPDPWHDRPEPLGWRIALWLLLSAVAWLFVWPVVEVAL